MNWIDQEMGKLVQLIEKIRSAFSAIDADKPDGELPVDPGSDGESGRQFAV